MPDNPIKNHWLNISAISSSSLIIYLDIVLLNRLPLLISSSIIRIFLCYLLSLYYALLLVSLPKKSLFNIKKKVNRDALELTFPCHYLPTTIYIGFWNFMRCFLHLFSLSIILFLKSRWMPLWLSNGQFQPSKQIARFKVDVFQFLSWLAWIFPLGLWWLFDNHAYHHT